MTAAAFWLSVSLREKVFCQQAYVLPDGILCSQMFQSFGVMYHSKSFYGRRLAMQTCKTLLGGTIQKHHEFESVCRLHLHHHVSAGSGRSSKSS
jgi:hypothetical protein